MPQPVPKIPAEASKSTDSDDWDYRSACNETKDPEPVPEEDSKVVEPALPGEPGCANMPAAHDPGVCEYYQPESSPYTGSSVRIVIGHSTEYIVPSTIAGQIPSLEKHCSGNGDQLARFPEVDEEIAHTFIHYLYTGDYQTLKPALGCNIPRRAVEYRRSVLAYHAGRRCGLEGLADHGKKYMQLFDRHVTLFDIIYLGRRYFSRITEDAWFCEYLTHKIMASFEIDEEIFQQEEFFNAFGEAPDFDRFLAKVMAETYACKISSVRYALDLRMDNATATMAMHRGSATSDGYDSDCTAPERWENPFWHAESQVYQSPSPSCEVPPWRREEAWLQLQREQCTEAESSNLTIVTPSLSTGEASDAGHVDRTSIDLYSQSGPDLGCGICPHRAQHLMHESLWNTSGDFRE
ncbi:hypothetical protein BDW62DRAFT_200791 [Aspergillus aurantiobrunneus]